ncbi:uncharacterized protein LOC126900961 [Daktulosphaira vitifoliae]|uniref:uncharacterized protein LOC126900961 n=1 Tax=Daktulosphaira vitifoliae TaxID=58002 RepID=UPI0021A9D1C4|nr:uncharacterized protein LOC126900961 [Daktulosphaira vitifoliae]
MIAISSASVFCLLVSHVLTFPSPGGQGQWPNPQMGMMGNGQNQRFGNQDFSTSQMQRGQRGFDNYGGGNNFGQNGFPQNRGGQWQGQGAEAYKVNVYNEPDRYGYDYTIPGANVHFMMHKKQGNRGSGNYGGNQGRMY